jgi:nitrogen fixation protein NifX
VEILDRDIPTPRPYREGDLPGSVRVAVASDTGLALDGQFSDCTRFLVYQVAAAECRLVGVRGTAGDRTAADRYAWRAGLIRDCRIVFVAGIGVRGHSHLVHNHAYVVRQPQPGSAAETLSELQRVLGDGPPPWLARLVRGPVANPVLVAAL